ncbi:MAG: helix-turn-helix domain-containing protein [Candidatus Delongbacteria bacterium]|nr:helix-turn-helix domain-containing protein [Candidatus Delongbacteria bacterium]
MGLFSGTAGISLFLFHLYDYSKNQEHKDTAQFFLEKSFEKINAGSTIPTYCNEIAGIAWTVNYLVKHSFIGVENLEVLDELDDYLNQSMMSYINNNSFDFLHGASGIALYFTCRANTNPKIIDYLKKYTELLNKYCIYDPYTESAKMISTVQDGNEQLNIVILLEEHFNITYSSLRKRFKKCTDIPLLTYRENLILDALRRKLIDNKCLSIMHEFGFKYESHFAKWFRKHTGLNPSEFKERYDNK